MTQTEYAKTCDLALSQRSQPIESKHIRAARVAGFLSNIFKWDRD